jgi:secreted PhoX family phosphatase
MHDDKPPALARRQLLKGGSAAIAAAFGGPIAAMASRVAEAACAGATASVLLDSPYGAPAPVKDMTTGLPLIELPPGFSYKSTGWRGDLMSDGLVTPPNHDGMGVALQRRVGRSTEIVLVRNHERSSGSNAADILGAGRAGVATYDTGHTTTGITGYQLGGTTNLVFRDGQWADSFASFGGTNRNCAGGVSTWGSWLTNEEVRSNTVSSTGRRHGYVFEVPADTSLHAANPEPIIGMGRMAHEASAIDSLHAGGTLQGLKVRGIANADMRSPTLCQEYDVEWVDIENPDLDGATLSTVLGSVSASGPFIQACAKGAAIFGANEGCWVANGVVWFTDKQVTTSPARAGRVWALDLATSTLKAVFVSNDITVGNSPDNLCVSPRGGVLFCEDGGSGGPNTGPAVTQQRLMVLHPNGGSSIFARNNFNFTAAELAAVGKSAASSGNRRNSEWCGACFSPDGRVLFVNLQGPGLTVAITGPWARGTL